MGGDPKPDVALPMGTERIERSRDFERFITFIDAIVAIAITLLVLPLVGLGSDLGDGSVLTLLSEHTTEIGAFLLSFVVIANSWFAQHQVVRGVIAHDPLVAWLMMGWVLTIVVLPFPTSLVAQSGHQAASKIFYIGTMALTSTTLALLCWAIAKRRDIRDSDAKPSPAEPIASTVGFILALGLSLIFPRTSYYPLLLLLLPGPLVSLWRRSNQKRPPAPQGVVPVDPESAARHP